MEKEVRHSGAELNSMNRGAMIKVHKSSFLRVLVALPYPFCLPLLTDGGNCRGIDTLGDTG